MASAPSEPIAWKQCADWLTRCGVLSATHPAVKPSGQFMDLAYGLRDGVVLCQLLNQLQPGAIGEHEYSQHPQNSLFLFTKNVKVFLRTCKRAFHMKDADLFDSIDLMDVLGFGKVISTLSKLSQTSSARRLNIEPFTLTVNNQQTCDDYMNFSSLKKAMGDGVFNNNDDDEDDLNDYQDFDDYHYLQSSNTKDEDLYGRLMDFVKPTEQPKPQEKKSKTHRELCVNELIDTEAKYTEVLKMIKEKFMVPLRLSPIARADYDCIFKDIDQLLAIHTHFLQELRRSYNKESSYSIADCFVMCKEKFLIYGDYCSNLLTAQERLDVVCQNQAKFQEELQRCQTAANDSQFKLREMLTVPVQRVLKYHLLLKELIKNTECADPEYRSLQHALQETEDLSLFVNEAKRDNEMLSVLNQLEKSINGLKLEDDIHLKDYGRLLMEGELKVKSDSSPKQTARYVLVLDKLILLCKAQPNDQFKFKEFITLNDYVCDDILSAGKQTSCGFTLTDNGRKNTFMFLAKSPEIRTKWINAIKMAKDNMQPRFSRDGGHNFIMFTFNRPTICDVCRKLLRGVFYQGYRCYNTGMNVHKECLEKAKFISGPPRIRRRNSEISDCSITSGSRPLPSPSDSSLKDAAYRKRTSRTTGYEETTCDPPSSRGALQRSATISLGVMEHRHSGGSDYINELDGHSWFAGDMSRDDAEAHLYAKPNGTFLVRISARNGETILSITCNGSVLHTVIQKTSSKQYYFTKTQTFDSLVELVQFYRTRSLEHVFKDLTTSLAIPYREAEELPDTKQFKIIGYCRVIYDYSARAPNQLTLREKERIGILSKAGENRGWWKGVLCGQVGYFPYAYVIEE